MYIVSSSGYRDSRMAGRLSKVGKKRLHVRYSWPTARPMTFPKHILRGPNDHINMRILHSGFKAQYKGDTRIHGILMFKWSAGALILTGIRLCWALEPRIQDT